MKWTASTIALIALCACGQPTSAPPAVEAPTGAQARAAPAAQPSLTVITPDGWGPLRVGMSAADVIAAVGDAPGASSDPNVCREFHPARAPEGVFVMFENGALSRISIREPSTVQSDRGLGVGAAGDAVMAAYGSTAQSEPHKYESAPSRYITAWTTTRPSGETYVTDPSARGVRYEIGADGNVRWIRAGGPSIQLVEGCS